MKNIQEIKTTVGSYEILTPIVEYRKPLLGGVVYKYCIAYYALIKQKNNVFMVTWDTNGHVPNFDCIFGADPAGVISLKDLSIDLESEYEKLCKQVAICKETIGGNEVGGLSVLPEYLWEHNYSRIIFGYELAKEQTGQVTAIPRGWDKTGIACPKDYNETYHLPQCLKLPNY